MPLIDGVEIFNDERCDGCHGLMCENCYDKFGYLFCKDCDWGEPLEDGEDEEDEEFRDDIETYFY